MYLRAAAFRIRCLRGRLVEIYENYSRLPRFRVFMHQRFSLSLVFFLSVFRSLSLSIHERSNDIRPDLALPIVLPRDMSKFPYANAGLSNKVGDGEIVPADFVRLAHPEVPPRLCSTFRRTTRLALPFVYAARRPCRFQRIYHCCGRSTEVILNDRVVQSHHRTVIAARFIPAAIVRVNATLQSVSRS